MVLVQWKNVTLGGVVKFTDGVDLTTKPTETWTFEEPPTMVLLAALLTPCNFYDDPVQILLFFFTTFLYLDTVFYGHLKNTVSTAKPTEPWLCC